MMRKIHQPRSGQHWLLTYIDPNYIKPPEQQVQGRVLKAVSVDEGRSDGPKITPIFQCELLQALANSVWRGLGEAGGTSASYGCSSAVLISELVAS